MAKIEGNCRAVCEAAEFVAIVTSGDDGPHVVGNWGEYLRALGIREDMLVLPAGRYQRTEQNLRSNKHIQLLLASSKVQGTRSMGQGYLIEGSGEVLGSGALFDEVTAKFPWARGALVIKVEKITAQL